jgi:hypothetical protein
LTIKKLLDFFLYIFIYTLLRKNFL